MKPLEGITVLDFSQYLAGPSAALRLADLGARVIKVENPNGGDGSRRMTLHNLTCCNDSVLFHTINRNKESFTANLKSSDDLAHVKRLIQKADVLIENFRPGIMERLGLGYEAIKKLNPRMIYASVTGYGRQGPLCKKPGQDLLLQSMSGLPWLNGNDDQPPLPFALSVVDAYTGAHLAQGILACLLRRCKTDMGARVEASLFESVTDMQFEVLTTYLNDGNKAPTRCHYNNAHAYLSAPYGVYETADSYLSLAMGSVVTLGELLDLPSLTAKTETKLWFDERDEIKKTIGDRLKQNTTSHWLALLQGAGYWCAPVNDWNTLIESDAFCQLDFLLDIVNPSGHAVTTSRCPIRINGEPLKPDKWAPALGEDTEKILKELGVEGTYEEVSL